MGAVRSRWASVVGAGVCALALIAATVSLAAPAVAAPRAATTDCPAPFSDVPANSQFCVAITWLRNLKITEGYAGNAFRPATPISRQALAEFLYRLNQPGSTAQCTAEPFDDVKTDNPFCPAITWMKGLKLTSGYPGNTFRPETPISRQALAEFLYRLHEPGASTQCTSAAFYDVPATSPFCPAITWMKNLNLADGYPGDTFRPQTPISRQAMAAFLYRMQSLS